MLDKPTTGSGPLRLADHVRACSVDGQVVLLDLDRNRYLCLGGPHAKLVASVIDRQTDAQNGITGPTTRTAEGLELVQPLLRARILTCEPGQARPQHLPVAPPAASVTARDAILAAGLRPVDLSRFVSAITLAAFWLRFRSLREISRAIEAKLRQCVLSEPDHRLRLGRAVTVFDRLRPLAFSARDQCLFDSIALTLFLAHHGLSARWVIGVTTRPFRAHSWVQHEGEVLNDLHEHVRPFTPILVL